jgi:hypothetical protein
MMSGVLQPSKKLSAARAALGDHAPVPREDLDRLGDTGHREIAGVLGPIDGAHAGWAQLFCSILVAGNSEALTPPIEDSDRRSLTAGLGWGATVAAAVGDRTIADGAEPGPWEPGPKAIQAREMAAQLADELVGATASDDARGAFTADTLVELDRELPGLDHAQAGWGLVALAAWVGTHSAALAEPLTRRRGLRRPAEPRRAAVGCTFAAALLAEIGGALLAEP